jgi:hypothetical protein
LSRLYLDNVIFDFLFEAVFANAEEVFLCATDLAINLSDDQRNRLIGSVFETDGCFYGFADKAAIRVLQGDDLKALAGGKPDKHRADRQQ